MTNPKIAAVIPTYNRAEKAARAVRSVLAQTVPVRCIVVDDGSTDGTAERLRDEFGERITVIEQVNQGQGAARNAGVIAAGDVDYIAFLDSDDVWHTTKTQRQVEAMLRNRAEWSFTDFSLVPDPVFRRHDIEVRGGPMTVTEYAAGYSDGFASWKREVQSRGRQASIADGRVWDEWAFILGPGDIAFMSTMIVSRRAIMDVRGFRPEYRRCQDFDLYLRLLLAGFDRGVWVDEQLVTRELAENAAPATTYRYKLSALREARAHASGDVRRRIDDLIAHDLRAMSGAARRERKVGGAVAWRVKSELARVGLYRPPVVA